MRSSNLLAGINILIFSRRSEYIMFECRYSPSQKGPTFTGSNPEWLNTPTSIGNRLDSDDDFGGLIHNANPSDADFSVYSTERPSANNNNNFGSWTPPPQQGENVTRYEGFIQDHQQRISLHSQWIASHGEQASHAPSPEPQVGSCPSLRLVQSLIDSSLP